MGPGQQGSSTSPKSVAGYDVLSELGRGGMGVVLLAHDSRLDRRVAIKSLNPETGLSPERLARFAREARTLASLNHPNVAQVYGLEEQAGAQYLVMEFVEGRSLAEMLDAGPLAVDEALRLAAQIAAGVEAAHEQGVIHRDLKPGNVVVTPEGKAKVLDFGLAREVETRSSTMNLSISPTATLPSASAPTVEGQVLGTVGYMSPEQARGKALSKRTDVWSFGCVLYEMLTGVQPFTGETASDVIAAVLEREPNFSKLPARTPHRVRELLVKCLEKDQTRRLRDIGDARLELEKAIADREWATQSLAAFPGDIRRRGRGGLLIAGIGAALSLAGGGALGWSLRERQDAGSGDGAAPASIMSRARFARVTDGEGLELFPSLSPDGKWVVYAAGDENNTDLFRQRVGGFNPTNLTANSPVHDSEPAVSPDGELIAFRSERDGGGIFIMGATGESPRRLTDYGHHPAWSPDGTKIACVDEGVYGSDARLTRSALWIVDVRTGERSRLPVEDAVQPSWSPDGSRIAYWTVVGGGQRDIHTVAVATGEVKPVMTDAPTDWNPVWAPDGKRLYFLSNRSGVMGVWRIAIDQATGTALGPPEPVTAGGGGSAFHLTVAGVAQRLAYALLTRTGQTWRRPLDPQTRMPTGSPERITRGSFSTVRPEVSPDGQWIAFTASDDGQEDLFLMRTDGTQRMRLTDDPARDRGAAWSPDSSRLVLYSDRGGKGYAVWTVNRDGSGLRQITPPGVRWILPSWMPDGKQVIAWNERSGMVLLDAEKDFASQSPRPLLEGLDPEFWPLQISADGRFLLCSKSGFQVLVALALPSGEQRLLLRDPFHARFVGDSSMVMVTTQDGMMLIDAATGESTPLPETAQLKTESLSIPLKADFVYFQRIEQSGEVWLIDLEGEGRGR